MSDINDKLGLLAAELASWRATVTDAIMGELAQIRERIGRLEEGVADVPAIGSAVALVEDRMAAIEDAVRQIADVPEKLAELAEAVRGRAEPDPDPLEELQRSDPVGYAVVKRLYDGPLGDAIRAMPLPQQVDLIDTVATMVKHGTVGTS